MARTFTVSGNIVVARNNKAEPFKVEPFKVVSLSGKVDAEFLAVVKNYIKKDRSFPRNGNVISGVNGLSYQPVLPTSPTDRSRWMA